MTWKQVDGAELLREHGLDARRAAPDELYVAEGLETVVPLLVRSMLSVPSLRKELTEGEVAALTALDLLGDLPHGAGAMHDVRAALGDVVGLVVLEWASDDRAEMHLVLRGHDSGLFNVVGYGKRGLREKLQAALAEGLPHGLEMVTEWSVIH